MVATPKNEQSPYLAQQENLLVQLAVASKCANLRLQFGQANINLLHNLEQQLLGDNNIDVKTAIELAYTNPAFETVFSKKILAALQWELLQILNSFETSLEMEFIRLFFFELELKKLKEDIYLATEIEDWFKRWHTSLNNVDENKVVAMKIMQQELIKQLERLASSLNEKINIYSDALLTVHARIKELATEIQSNNHVIGIIRELKICAIHDGLAPLRTNRNIKFTFPEWPESAMSRLKKTGASEINEIEINTNYFVNVIEKLMITKSKNGEANVRLTNQDKEKIIKDTVILMLDRDEFVALSSADKTALGLNLEPNVKSKLNSYFEEIEIAQNGINESFANLHASELTLLSKNSSIQSQIIKLESQGTALEKAMKSCEVNKEKIDSAIEKLDVLTPDDLPTFTEELLQNLNLNEIQLDLFLPNSQIENLFSLEQLTPPPESSLSNLLSDILKPTNTTANIIEKLMATNTKQEPHTPNEEKNKNQTLDNLIFPLSSGNPVSKSSAPHDSTSLETNRTRKQP